jgi:hypothetical protein
MKFPISKKGILKLKNQRLDNYLFVKNIILFLKCWVYLMKKNEPIKMEKL